MADAICLHTADRLNEHDIIDVDGRYEMVRRVTTAGSHSADGFVVRTTHNLWHFRADELVDVVGRYTAGLGWVTGHGHVNVVTITGSRR